MKYLIDNDFKQICQSILNENKSLEEWSEIESDDMFQQGNIIGGFDATEEEFCFSVYISDEEYWFQVPLTDIPLILSGEIVQIETRKAFSD